MFIRGSYEAVGHISPTPNGTYHSTSLRVIETQADGIIR